MRLLKLFCLIVVFFTLTSCSSQFPKENIYKVSAVLDGDTVILSINKNVRYLGIDTPESRKKINNKWVYNPQPFAKEATSFNRKAVEGKSVKLEFEKEATDRYGRWLAYVFADGKMINEELLRNGLAKLYIRQKNLKYEARLKAAELEAKREKIGLWSLNK